MKIRSNMALLNCPSLVKKFFSISLSAFTLKLCADGNYLQNEEQPVEDGKRHPMENRSLFTL